MADVPDGYELIRGKLVEVEPMSFYANKLANRLTKQIILNPQSRESGDCYAESYFRVPTPGDRTKIRRADLAFVSYNQLPEYEPTPLNGNAISAVPELVVEIQSPTDLIEDLFPKMRHYFAAGVKAVWLVFPSI